MKKNSKHPLEDLITKYKEGNISEKEELILMRFLDTYRKQQSWDVELGEKETVKDAIKVQLDQRIYKQKRSRSNIAYAVAASLVLLIGSMYFAKIYNTSNTLNWVIAQTSDQIDSLLLSDGSTIFLNQNTRFEYPEQFTGNVRGVKLIKGSAFFKVAKDSIKPFIITSGELRTKVLGTSFNIINRDSLFNVTVNTGKVNVSNKMESFDLLPNEQVQLDQANKRLLKRNVNAQVYSGWMHKDVDYPSISLNDLSTVVELRYGIPFQFEEVRLKDHKVKVSFLKDDTLNQVIEKLNFITNVKLKKEKNVIKVTAN
ncbi:FecR family protein [Zhouia amylolytica]|uniref:Uncharacterized protein n=1 Tax=Zhouia amylolytica AD3 TaxID=1286632 RepID=W2UL23_9FLAO|nr:FecR family protein [Zhouia amylolytica]ETN94845.1 hypothetical protein P278_27880 [Zhouia amylolytica AD3]